MSRDAMEVDQRYCGRNCENINHCKAVRVLEEARGYQRQRGICTHGLLQWQTR